MFFKDTGNALFYDPSSDVIAKHSLVEISKKEFDDILVDVNTPTPEKKIEQAQADRRAAYATEADPLFFKAQRGEATIEEWEAKVEQIRSRYPYPAMEVTP